MRCDRAAADLLRPLLPYFSAMAGATATAMGPDVAPPATCATFAVSIGEVFVNLADHIDLDAEIRARRRSWPASTARLPAKKGNCLTPSSPSGAPAEVIERKRAAL